MSEPKSPVTIEPVDEIQETVIEEVSPPSLEIKPDGIITTERKGGILRDVPLRETHGMTTEANRFKEN